MSEEDYSERYVRLLGKGGALQQVAIAMNRSAQVLKPFASGEKVVFVPTQQVAGKTVFEDPDADTSGAEP